MHQLVVAILGSALILSAATPLSAQAIPIEYRISGLLTGRNSDLLNPLELLNVPFDISISADTDTAFRFGTIPGSGTAFVNNSVYATWSVEGFGTAFSYQVQVVSIPATAAFGFGWNGEIYPIDTNQPAERVFGLSSGVFALNSRYGLLNAVVPTVSLTLQTDLRNPPGAIPAYSTSIRFPGQGSLTLMELNSLTYSVVAVPEPGTALLLGAGLAGLSSRRRERMPRAGRT